MAAKSLQRHILGLIGVTLLVVSLAITIAVWVSTDGHVRAQVNNDLQVGQSVLQRLLSTREQQLLTSAEVLTADFGFKQVVASSDAATIESVLSNHGYRIQADLMAIVSLDGQIVASTSPVLKRNSIFNSANLLSFALDQGAATDFVQLDTDIYQIIMLPVRAPVTVGVALIGFRLSQQLANELKQITHLDVTFSARRKGGKPVSVSTLIQPALNEALSSAETLNHLRTPFVRRGRFATRQFDLSSREALTVYLSASLDEAYSRFDVLQLEILAITLLAILLSLLGGVIFSRKLTSPLKRLAALASEIASGQYRQEVKVSRNVDEITNLMSAFNTMQADLSEREARIIYQAHHDPLTGLVNRQHAVTLLDDILAQPDVAPLLVVVVNILGFRSMNDTFGHHVGDMTLKEVSRRLQVIDGNDRLTARLVGNEFLMVMSKPAAPNEKLSAVMASLLKPYTIGNLEISLTFSMGVAVFPDDATNAMTLIQRASIALDTARRERRPVTYYNEQQEEMYRQRLTLLADLKTALADDDGQLQMYYQPKIHFATGRAARFEALIRWIHPQQGFIAPDIFIPLAEQSNLINTLTDWIVTTVIRQLEQWQREGLNTCVAINLSAQDLTRGHILDHVTELLTRYGVPAESVSFEITESEVMREPEKAIALLEQFRTSGFHLAIDDFGTGYSSLSQLKNMPVTELKIDRSFVTQLSELVDDQIIVRSTIALAHSFNLDIVAEGVEDEATANLLRQWGVDWVQGYYFSRPLPAGDVLQWVTDYNHRQLPRIAEFKP